MKKSKLLLLLALISLAACKKSNPLIEEHIQLKNVQNDTELDNAIGDLVKGFEHGFSLYSEFEKHPVSSREFYRCIWTRPIQGHESMLYRIQVQTLTSANPFSDSNDPNIIFIDDPRLGKPPYSNISITKVGFSDDSRWIYVMYIDSYEQLKFTQSAYLSGGLTSSSDSWDSSVQAPPMPSDKAVVTALLGLIEPISF